MAVAARKEIGPATLSSAAWRLPENARPALVHVLDEMPLSSAGRPSGTTVRRDGIDLARPAWRYDAAREEYRPLTAAALAKLLP